MAVSGGPDSLALLLLAHGALPGRVLAATVDHGLRPESPAEAHAVAALCRRIGVPHEIAHVHVAAGNLQERARAARYAALCASFARRGARVFATAHHAEDQAETVLMRLARGSGLAGLAGIRARRTIASPAPTGDCLVVRPLLAWRRAELAGVLSAAGVEAAEDPSNADPRFDRVRMRERLAAMPWLDPRAVARSAALLQEAEEAVDAAVAGALAYAMHREGDRVWLHRGHGRLIEIEAVTAILRELGASAPRSAVAQMVERLHADGHATLAGIKARRAKHRREGSGGIDAWRFEREGPRGRA